MAFYRGTAALLVVALVATLNPALSAPGEIFETAAPILGSDPPPAADLKEGDASVSTQTGALQYSYPIVVPPGRNGMAPSLALSYSSQAPTYGGIAAGWTLSIPEIREDSSKGRLRTRAPEVEAQQSGVDAKIDDTFVSSLAGGRPLVAVTEPFSKAAGVYQTYRAQNDSSYARYERMESGQAFRWRAHTTEGVVMTFGATAQTSTCGSIISDQYAPLTGMVDSFGNEVSYDYQLANGECTLTTIRWGQNGALPSFAEVQFTYARAPACSGTDATGAQIDYRTGAKILTGINRITRITARAMTPDKVTTLHTREINLTYDATAEGTGPSGCSLTHAPLRLLTSIQESAWGPDAPLVNRPPIEFTYNSPTTSLTSAASLGVVWPSTLARPNLGWGYRRNDGRWS